jgi:predicted esterase
MRLLVWLHSCGENSAQEINTVTKDDTSYLAIAVDGREGDCWIANADGPKVLQAIANMKTHFNVDPHHVVIGGYSAGGDLAYRTAFYNANTFAGVLAENTLPFRDTGSTQSQSLAAAAWKFNAVHLFHTGDTVYTKAEVQNETKAMQDAGFPVTVVEKPGGHADSTTTPDLQTYLLPHMADPWSSP